MIQMFTVQGFNIDAKQPRTASQSNGLRFSSDPNMLTTSPSRSRQLKYRLLRLTQPFVRFFAEVLDLVLRAYSRKSS